MTAEFECLMIGGMGAKGTPPFRFEPDDFGGVVVINGDQEIAITVEAAEGWIEVIDVLKGIDEYLQIEVGGDDGVPVAILSVSTKWAEHTKCGLQNAIRIANKIADKRSHH